MLWVCLSCSGFFKFANWFQVEIDIQANLLSHRKFRCEKHAANTSFQSQQVFVLNNKQSFAIVEPPCSSSSCIFLKRSNRRLPVPERSKWSPLDYFFFTCSSTLSFSTASSLFSKCWSLSFSPLFHLPLLLCFCCGLHLVLLSSPLPSVPCPPPPAVWWPCSVLSGSAFPAFFLPGL